MIVSRAKNRIGLPLLDRQDFYTNIMSDNDRPHILLAWNEKSVQNDISSKTCQEILAKC